MGNAFFVMSRVLATATATLMILSVLAVPVNADEPIAVEITNCAPGTPTCTSTYTTQNDCDTHPNCAGNENCQCQWKPTALGDRCVCQNFTGM